MERVAFVIERTGERIDCLLNPATFTFVREAGVRPLRTLSGALSGTASADDPLLATGGGRTELTLELLFDISKQPGATADSSVQALTAPLWNLAENSDTADGHGRPPLVRFVWGKAWNVPSIVVSAAERFEQFTPAGVPQRSWLKLRLVRAALPVEPEAAPAVAFVPPGDDDAWLNEVPEDQVQIHEVGGERPADDAAAAALAAAPAQVERIDELAARYLGQASLWPVLAAFNRLVDPARLVAGSLLRIPPAGSPPWR